MITVNDILTQFQTFKAKINEYYALIQGAADADANLDGLDSVSTTADFNLWMYISAAVAVIVDGVQEERKADIQTIADNAIPGTERWLQKEIFKFQYGDALVFDPDTAKYSYAVIDPAKQIIARCAISSQGTISYVKVAKLAGGVPVALSAPELVAFKSFVNQIKWAGMQLVVISTNADLLNAPMTVYYNGIIPLADIKAVVEPAYLAYLAALPFNGQYSITKHVDAVELVANVNDVVAGEIQAKTNGGGYADVTRIYNPVSGYLKSDPALSLDDLITYIAQ